MPLIFELPFEVGRIRILSIKTRTAPESVPWRL